MVGSSVAITATAQLTTAVEIATPERGLTGAALTTPCYRPSTGVAKTTAGADALRATVNVGLGDELQDGVIR